MAGRRLPAFCRGGRTVAVATAATTTRVRKRVQRVAAGYHAASKQPPPAAAANASYGGRTCGGADAPGAGRWCHSYGGGGADMVGAAAVAGAGGGKKDSGGRRVMVVADGRAEAAGALQWALSQAVRCNDSVLLLAVVRPAAASAGDGGESSCVNISRTRCYQQLDAMRSMCESARPEVKVEVCVMEAAGERAPAVVEAARHHGASLLVLGQRRRRRGAVIARWLQLALWPPAAAAKNKWRRRSGRSTTVEYCIEHASCVALGVRRRSSGGYLVSSKRHKDFWLLA